MDSLSALFIQNVNKKIVRPEWKSHYPIPYLWFGSLQKRQVHILFWTILHLKPFNPWEKKKGELLIFSFSSCEKIKSIWHVRICWNCEEELSFSFRLWEKSAWSGWRGGPLANLRVTDWRPWEEIVEKWQLVRLAKSPRLAIKRSRKLARLQSSLKLDGCLCNAATRRPVEADCYCYLKKIKKSISLF